MPRLSVLWLADSHCKRRTFCWLLAAEAAEVNLANILECPQGCQYPRGVLLYLLCAAHKLRQVSVNALREAALVSPTSSSMELRSPAIQHRCRGLVAHVCQAELGRRSATRNAN